MARLVCLFVRLEWFWFDWFVLVFKLGLVRLLVSFTSSACECDGRAALYVALFTNYIIIRPFVYVLD